MHPEIDLTVTHRFSSIRIADAEYKELLNIASWSTRPWFPAPGRTAWYRFKSVPCLVDAHGRYFPAAKLKGVGVWNPPQHRCYLTLDSLTKGVTIRSTAKQLHLVALGIAEHYVSTTIPCCFAKKVYLARYRWRYSNTETAMSFKVNG